MGARLAVVQWLPRVHGGSDRCLLATGRESNGHRRGTSVAGAVLVPSRYKMVDLIGHIYSQFMVYLGYVHLYLSDYFHFQEVFFLVLFESCF